MTSDQEDPRSAQLGITWMTEKGAKTRAAITDLLTLLLRIGEDLKVEDDEIQELILWKVSHRHVLNRPAIRPFAEWLDRILADGEVSSEERLDLLGWCHWAKTNADKFQQVFDGVQGVEIPPPPVPREGRGKSWRSDPATGRQLSFLEDLGADPTKFSGLTKGAASAMIDRLLAQRDENSAREFAAMVKAHMGTAWSTAEAQVPEENVMSHEITLEDVLKYSAAAPPRPIVEPRIPPRLPPPPPPRYQDPKAVFMAMQEDDLVSKAMWWIGGVFIALIALAIIAKITF